MLDATNLVEALRLVREASPAPVDSNKWSSITTIVGIVIGFLTLLIPIVKLIITMGRVEKDVNSNATAMREELRISTRTILDLSKQVAGMKEAERGQVTKDAVTAALSAQPVESVTKAKTETATEEKIIEVVRKEMEK